MPTYEFLNNKTGKLEEYMMSIKVYDAFKDNNPHLQRYYGEPPMFSYNGTGDMAGKKTDNTWKEVMHKIAEQNPASPLADKVLRKTSKQVKTDQVIKKYLKNRQREQTPK
jgi:hypothetical protein